MEKFDFLIIGGGIAGASAGYFLSAHGRVCVLEMEDAPGYHSTGRSAAFYAPSYGNDAVRALTLASGDFLENPPEGFCDGPLVSPRGALYVGRADQRPDVEAHLARSQSFMPDARLMQADEIVATAKLFRSGYAASGVFEPVCHDIDVAKLQEGYLRGLRRTGQLVTRAPAQTLFCKDGLWHASTPNGDFAAPIVVNAAGAWGDVLAQKANVRPLGLQPKRRTVVLLPGYDDVDISDLPLVLDVGEQFYFKPDAGRILLSPSDETPAEPCDIQPDELDVAKIINLFEEFSGRKVSRIEHTWAGLRTFAPDRALVIGEAPDAPGFFWCVGQGGYGIKTSPAAGLLLSQRVIGASAGASDLNRELYDPARFLT